MIKNISNARKIKNIEKEFKINQKYSKDSINFLIENVSEFKSHNNDKAILKDIRNVMNNDKYRSETVTKIFSHFCEVSFEKYFDDISGTDYIDVVIDSEIPEELETKLKSISDKITREAEDNKGKDKFTQEMLDELIL